MLLFATALAALGASDLELNEVLPAPAAGDPIVELANSGAIPCDTASVRLVVGGTSQVLPSTLLQPGALVRLHVGVAGVDTATDLFLPGVAVPSPVAASVALYVAGPVNPPGSFFADPDNMVDFVQWGAPFQAFATVAEAALVWFWADTFAGAPGGGQSLAFDGAGKQAEDWFRDAGPTPGQPNVQPTADAFVFGAPCSPAAFHPMLGTLTPPALGNLDFAVFLATQSVLQPGVLILGTSTGSIPILGGACTLHVAGIFKMLPILVPADGLQVFPFPVPEDAGLVGGRVVLQAALLNGFGFDPGIDLSPGLVVDL